MADAVAGTEDSTGAADAVESRVGGLATGLPPEVHAARNTRTIELTLIRTRAATDPLLSEERTGLVNGSEPATASSVAPIEGIATGSVGRIDMS